MALEKVYAKLQYDSEIVYLQEYPKSIKQLLTKAKEVFNGLSQDENIQFCYLDEDQEQINISNDQDLMLVKERLLTEGRSRVKFIIHQKNKTQGSFLSSPCNEDGFLRQLEKLLKGFLKANDLPLELMNSDQIMPCKECLTKGKTILGDICVHCMGKGTRPITSSFIMTRAMIHSAFHKFILSPLQVYLGISQTVDDPKRIEEGVNAKITPSNDFTNIEYSESSHKRGSTPSGRFNSDLRLEQLADKVFEHANSSTSAVKMRR